MTQRRHISLLLVAAVAAGGLAGCSFREAICRSGEYPVAAVDSTTGRACVAEGQEPPAGYVRFPAGKVPEHVGDEWDRYWGEHELDEHGNEVPRSPGGTGAPVPRQPLMPWTGGTVSVRASGVPPRMI